MVSICLITVGATLVVGHGSAFEILVVVFDIDVSLGVSIASRIVGVTVHLTCVLKLTDLIHHLFSQVQFVIRITVVLE